MQVCDNNKCVKKQGTHGTKSHAFLVMQVAGGRGFELRLTDSESAVLPLDEPPVSAPRLWPITSGWQCESDVRSCMGFVEW